MNSPRSSVPPPFLPILFPVIRITIKSNLAKAILSTIGSSIRKKTVAKARVSNMGITKRYSGANLIILSPRTAKLSFANVTIVLHYSCESAFWKCNHSRNTHEYPCFTFSSAQMTSLFMRPWSA